MKTLVLSCNTGEGHNSCANAIKETFESYGEECRIEDSLKFISEKTSEFISGWHVRIYRYIPNLFRFGYRFAENHSSEKADKSGFLTSQKKGTDCLFHFIRAGNYDTVICTHVFSALMLTDVLKKHKLSIKTAFIATDYTCSPGVKESCLDEYFIPDDSLIKDFECPNIPKNKMKASGIPIRKMFLSRLEKDGAKKLFDIPSDHKHLLIMCGSMGCGPIFRLAHELSDRLPSDCDLTIVCGTNAKLKEKLEKKYSGFENIHIRGYVQDMSALLDSADLYLTKPGGISITEAASKALPMVFVDAVAGCEEYNRRYFTQKKAAADGSGVKEIADICIEILSGEDKRRNMSLAFADEQKKSAAECIYFEMKTLRAV